MFSAVSTALVDHYLVDEDEGVVAFLGYVVTYGFVLDVLDIDEKKIVKK